MIFKKIILGIKISATPAAMSRIFGLNINPMAKPEMAIHKYGNAEIAFK